MLVRSPTHPGGCRGHVAARWHGNRWLASHICRSVLIPWGQRGGACGVGVPKLLILPSNARCLFVLPPTRVDVGGMLQRGGIIGACGMLALSCAYLQHPWAQHRPKLARSGIRCRACLERQLVLPSSATCLFVLPPIRVDVGGML